MIYELRTYWAAPGKLDALNTRFRNITMGLFARHNIKVVGFWMPLQPTPESGDLIYVLAFDDQAALAAAWNAFREDPEWKAGRAASEVDGPLTAKVTSVVMHSTDYSPVK
jgi:NIPSNAP